MWSHPVTSEDELRELLGPVQGAAALKEIDFLDEHARAFIAASPFFVLATSGADGTADSSPRGGPPGFVRIVGERRLAWADYTGNRRAESHANVLERPGVGLLFLLPGLGETLRVNGRATLTRDPELLASLPTGGKAPKLAFGVEVDSVYLHCAKAFRRSGLWDPSSWPQELPSPARILRDHARLDVPEESISNELEEAYRERLW